jgi:hypothetical protein
MSEDKLKARLAEFMSKLSVEPSKKELDNAVKGVFKDKKKPAKDSGDVKPKRQLSAWNIFYKEQSAILKLAEESKDKSDRMSAKEKMSYIASLWKQKSSNTDETEAFQEAPEEPAQEPESESEPEPEPEPVAKTSKPSTEGKGKFGAAKFGGGGGSKKDGKK